MLGDIVVELGYITEEQFMRILATRLQVPFVDLATTPISTEAVKKFRKIWQESICFLYQHQ